MVGASKVGKTSLCVSGERILKIKRAQTKKEEIVQLRLLEVESEKLFNSSISHNHWKQFKNLFADAVVLMFDLSNIESLHALQNLDLGSNIKNMARFLVANKSDLDDNEHTKRCRDMAMQYAATKESAYFEVSVKENVNITELFEKIAMVTAIEYDKNHEALCNFLEQSCNVELIDGDIKNDDKEEGVESKDIGTKQYLAENDYTPLKQIGARNDNVYYYQNICLSDKVFDGKSPEELRFEDKYSESATKNKFETLLKQESKTQCSALDYAKLINEKKKKSIVTDQSNGNANNDENNGLVWNGNTAQNEYDNKTNQSNYSFSFGIPDQAVIEESVTLSVDNKNKDDKEDELECVNRNGIRVGDEKKGKQTADLNDIDKVIVSEVAAICSVSIEIAEKALISNLWNADITINKIKSLQKFGYSLSIKDQNLHAEKRTSLLGVDAVVHEINNCAEKPQKEM